MIPADKRSQFKAPHMKNNIYKQFRSHILDEITPAIYENIVGISIEVFSRISLWQAAECCNNMHVCKVIWYVVSTMHKL